MYKFLISHKSNERIAAIMDAARMYNLFPYEVCSLYNEKCSKMNAKYGRSIRGNYDENTFFCGLDAIKVFTDNYDATLAKYRRYDNCVVDPSDRKAFFGDLGAKVYDSGEMEFKGTWHLDIETNGLSPFKDDSKILSVAINGRVYSQVNDIKNLPKPSIIVGHNIKFDLLWLLRFGIDLTEIPLYDTMVAEHLIDENRPKGLEELIFRYTDMANYWFDIDPKDMINLSFEKLSKYNSLDTRAVYEIAKKQHKLIPSQRLFEFEMKKLVSLLRIEFNGMRIDKDLLCKKMLETDSFIQEQKEQLSLVKPGLNLNSGPQLRRYLYEEKKYPITSFTEKGNPSVDNDVLEDLRTHHPEDRLLVHLSEFRKSSKLYSTYYKNIREKSTSRGYLHSGFNQAQVVTGRLSSGGGVNLQNIPSKNKDAVETLFISRYPNGKIIKIDYSQLELRVLASLSNDKVMLEAFNKGMDFHEHTAQMLHVDRNKAKTINFRIVYGGGTREETEAWFKAYPGAKEWIDGQVAFYYLHGYTVSPLGRIRHLPPPPKGDWVGLRHAERQAVNSIVQGMASDICMQAVNIITYAKTIDYMNKFPKFEVVNTVHDSIILDTEDASEYLLKDMKHICEDLVKQWFCYSFKYEFKCPLKVSIEVGPSWGECK